MTIHQIALRDPKTQTVIGYCNGAWRNTGRSRLALSSRYVGLLHGWVAWPRVGS